MFLQKALVPGVMRRMAVGAARIFGEHILVFVLKIAGVELVAIGAEFSLGFDQHPFAARCVGGVAGHAHLLFHREMGDACVGEIELILMAILARHGRLQRQQFRFFGAVRRVASRALALLKRRMAIRVFQLFLHFGVTGRTDLHRLRPEHLVFGTLMRVVAARALALGHRAMHDGKLKGPLLVAGETERRSRPGEEGRLVRSMGCMAFDTLAVLEGLMGRLVGIRFLVVMAVLAQRRRRLDEQLWIVGGVGLMTVHAVVLHRRMDDAAGKVFLFVASQTQFGRGRAQKMVRRTAVPEVTEDAVAILIRPVGRFLSGSIFVAVHADSAALFSQKPALIRSMRRVAFHALAPLRRIVRAFAFRRVLFDFGVAGKANLPAIRRHGKFRRAFRQFVAGRAFALLDRSVEIDEEVFIFGGVRAVAGQTIPAFDLLPAMFSDKVVVEGVTFETQIGHGFVQHAGRLLAMGIVADHALAVRKMGMNVRQLHVLACVVMAVDAFLAGIDETLVVRDVRIVAGKAFAEGHGTVDVWTAGNIVVAGRTEFGGREFEGKAGQKPVLFMAGQAIIFQDWVMLESGLLKTCFRFSVAFKTKRPAGFTSIDVRGGRRAGHKKHRTHEEAGKGHSPQMRWMKA